MSSIDPPLTSSSVEYSLSVKQLTQANRNSMKVAKNTAFTGAISAVLILAALVLGGLIGLTFGSVGVGFGVLAVRVWDSPRLRAHKQVELCGDGAFVRVRLTVDDDGLTIDDGEVATTTGWSVLELAETTDHWISLEARGIALTSIPAAVLPYEMEAKLRQRARTTPTPAGMTEGAKFGLVALTTVVAFCLILTTLVWLDRDVDHGTRFPDGLCEQPGVECFD